MDFSSVSRASAKIFQKLELNNETTPAEITNFLSKNNNQKNFKIYVKNNKVNISTEDSFSRSDEGKDYSSDSVRAALKDLKKNKKINLFLKNISGNLKKINSNEFKNLDFSIFHESVAKITLPEHFTLREPDVFDFKSALSDKILKKLIKSIPESDKKSAEQNNQNYESAKKAGKILAQDVLSEKNKYVKKCKELSLICSDGAYFKNSFRKILQDHFQKNVDDEFLDVMYESLMQNSSGYFDHEKIIINGDIFYSTNNEAGASLGGKIMIYNDKKNENSVVVKEMKFPEFPGGKNPKLLEKYNQEIKNKFDALKSEIRHHYHAMGIGQINIVSLFGAIKTPDNLILVLENCARGNLASLFDEAVSDVMKGLKFSQQDSCAVRLTLFKDMLAGLDFLHNYSKVIHVDFKPVNVFISESGHAKIGDFGESTSGPAAVLDEINVDNAAWLAPEVLKQGQEMKYKIAELKKQELNSSLYKNSSKADQKILDSKFDNMKNELMKNSIKLTKAMDMYSLGVTAYQLCYGTFPFPYGGTGIDGEKFLAKFFNMSSQERVDFLFKYKPILPELAMHQSQIQKLLFLLLEPDPSKRITAENALTNPLFEIDDVGSTETRHKISDLFGALQQARAAAAADLENATV